MRNKPESCYSVCPLAYKGHGFAANFIGQDPKIALMLAGPTSDDVGFGILGNGSMFKWFEINILKPLGKTKQDLIVASLIHCYNKEPLTGKLKKEGELNCRRYDDMVKGEDIELVSGGGLLSWKPDSFLVNFDLSLARKVTAIQYLVKQCINKAFDFADAGYRPCVFMGDVVTEYFAPWLLKEAGHKQWYGHWWEGALQESTNTRPFESQLYMPAKMPKKRYGRKKVVKEKSEQLELFK